MTAVEPVAVWHADDLLSYGDGRVDDPIHAVPFPGLQGGVMAPCAQAAALPGGEVDVQGRRHRG